jgi:hypothetical protein
MEEISNLRLDELIAAVSTNISGYFSQPCPHFLNFIMVDDFLRSTVNQFSNQ